MRSPTLVLALTLALAAAGCLGGGEAPPTDSQVTFTNVVTRGTELVGSKAIPFLVDEGALAVTARLNWTSAARLGLTVVGPGNSSMEKGGLERAGRVSLVTTGPVTPGLWEARVTSTTPGDTPFDLTIVTHKGPPRSERVFAVVELDKGRFAEANVVLAAGATVTWKFDSTAPVAWDVHTHDARTGEVVTPASGSGVTHSGPFTAARNGLHSFYWQAKEGPARVTYEIEGVMRVHSHQQA